MKWLEIITLRSCGYVDTQIVDEVLREAVGADAAEHFLEIRIYHHSVVDTDLSVHIYGKSTEGSRHKSPLGLIISQALRNLGLVNHSVWVETGGLEIPPAVEPSETGA